uniref:Vps72/YL1 C-terminal domain-containing protein n=1 Tax=Anopheles culicifacies TaxID=139723 RepID=A0A182MF17_9DIPT
MGKKRQWKSLKQILTHEKTLPWKETDITFNAPPSLKPAKKYSDISGLIAPYTDPHSKLRYHNVEEYQTIRTFPMDLTAGYLALRGYAPSSRVGQSKTLKLSKQSLYKLIYHMVGISDDSPSGQ